MLAREKKMLFLNDILNVLYGTRHDIKIDILVKVGQGSNGPVYVCMAREGACKSK